MTDEQIAEFGRRMLAELKLAVVDGGWEMQVDTMADIAVECGLMKYVPFNPIKHNSSFCDHEFEVGDMIYWWGD